MATTSRNRSFGLPRGAMLLIGLAILAGIALTAQALSRVDGGIGTTEGLRAFPEASLVYPDSVVIAMGGRGAEQTTVGRLSATSWQFLGVDANPSEIEAFYASELAERGWAEGGGSSGIGSVEELITRAWSKDGVVFRLGIRDPGYWGADAELFALHESIYDARLIDQRDR